MVLLYYIIVLPVAAFMLPDLPCCDDCIACSLAYILQGGTTNYDVLVETLTSVSSILAFAKAFTTRCNPAVLRYVYMYVF